MMGSKKTGKTHEVYIKFLMGIFPILLILALTMTVIYYWSIEVINQQIYEKNLAVLQNSAETIKKTFNNMDNLIAYIDESPKINRFFTSVNPINDGSTTIDMLDIQKELKALTIANDLLKNIQIYSRKNNILIDSATNALFIKRYYTHSFTIKNMSFDYWYNKILMAPSNYDIYPNLDIMINSQTQRSILYAKSLPMMETQNIDGGVYIYLDEAYLLKLFSNIPYQNSGFIYILRENGESILYDNGSDLDHPQVDVKRFTNQNGYFYQNIEGRDMFITYLKDDSRNWVYIAALPKDQVLAPTAGIRFYMGILVLLSLLAGGVLLFLSVAKLSRPITNVYKLLAEKNISLSYNDFEYEISKLVEHNREMQNALNSQIPELKTSIFYNLLIGGFHSAEEIRENLSKINITLDAKFYVVLIASINDLDPNSKLEEISARKIYINNILTQHFDNVQGVYNLDFGRTVLLLSYDQSNYIDVMELVEKTAQHVVEELYTSINMSISFSGDIANNIAKIPSSFFNANIAINYRQKNPSYTVQWFNRAKQIDKASFYYPIDMESQLMALVNVGNTAALSELFEEIDHRNKHIIGSDNNPTFFNLLQSMNSTLVRIFNDSVNHSKKAVQIEERISSNLKKRENLLQTFYLLKEAFMCIAIDNKDKIRQNNCSLQYQIKQYINEHYTNPQLSLSSVASVFGITEAYLSSLFKQTTGENFSKYVEKLRMEKARQLIEQGGFLINEIAEMVGYNSPQVFRRAYKRHYGTTPTCAKLQKSTS